MLSGYFGKLSFNRKAEDNERMIALYSSAWERWKDVAHLSSQETRKFIKEIAREEIVENGIWCSYVKDNSLDIQI